MGRPGDWLYPAEMVTNQQPSQLAITCIQEKLLDHLPKEIPYVIDVVNFHLHTCMMAFFFQLDMI